MAVCRLVADFGELDVLARISGLSSWIVWCEIENDFVLGELKITVWTKHKMVISSCN
jgi:hypothetical protein